MSAGFLSPGILFLSTWDQAERDYMLAVSSALRRRGDFHTVIEPCAGAYVMPRVHRMAGWPAESMEMSDVCLFTSVLGCVCSGTPLSSLEVRVDGELLPLTGSVVDDGAIVLYEQLRLRMAAKPKVAYWNEMRRDIDLRRDAYVEQVRSRLAENAETFRGSRYSVEDMWRHMRRYADDPGVVISINPPTYKGGFERFYDTKGRLTWAEPEYEVFDAAVHQYEIAEEARGWKALLLCQQQCEPGRAAGHVVHARDLSRGQIVVVWTNRPDDVTEAAGVSAVTRVMGETSTKPDMPIVEQDVDVEAAKEAWVVKIKPSEARYLKELWMHKLDFKNAGTDFAVVVDGSVVGIAGYDLSAIYKPYQEHMRDAVIMTYAVGAPHAQRLTRLVTTVAMSRAVVDAVAESWAAAQASRVVTVEYTKYHEAKGLRGIMSLLSREKDKKYGQKLIYGSPLVERSATEALEEWKRKERVWRKTRQAPQAAEKRPA